MSRLWLGVLAVSLAVDVGFQAITSLYGCPTRNHINMHLPLPTESELNADFASIASVGPLAYSQRVLPRLIESEIATKRPLVVVLPLNSDVAPDASGLVALLSLARWAKSQEFIKPVHFVVRDGNSPSSEENRADSVILLGALGHFNSEEHTQRYDSLFPSWFSRRADYVAFLSNERARGLTNVVVGLFSSACELNVACVKTSRPALSLFPAFNKDLDAAVPTVLVTDTALYRPKATLDVKRLAEIVGGLEAVIEGLAGEHSQPLG